MSKRGLFSAVSLMTAAAALASGAGVAQAAPDTTTQKTVQSSHDVHGHGFDYKAARAAHKGTPRAGRDSLRDTDLPTSYSLEQYAPSAGDQGSLNSCTAWATAYTGFGILMNEAGAKGTPMAPMSIYSLIVDELDQGKDKGTFAHAALIMELIHGVDTQSDYWQGTTDYKTLPTYDERSKAFHYRLGGFTDLTNFERTTAIKNAISHGRPVTIGFQVRSNFQLINPSNSYYDPSKGILEDSGHEVTIVGYDANGVKLENSYGTDWGDNGYFTAPWSWVTSGDVEEIYSMNSLALS